MLLVVVVDWSKSWERHLVGLANRDRIARRGWFLLAGDAGHSEAAHDRLAVRLASGAQVSNAAAFAPVRVGAAVSMIGCSIVVRHRRLI